MMQHLKEIKKISIYLSLFILTLCNTAFAVETSDTNSAQFNTPYALPHQEAVPGGIALVPITTRNSRLPTIVFQKKRVLVSPTADKNKWIAVIGLPLALKPGTYPIMVSQGGSIQFAVKHKFYPLYHITIKNKRKVFPNKQDLIRIQQETEQKAKFMGKFSKYFPLTKPFIAPIAGEISNGFGVRRIYNKSKPGQHSGIDIAAPAGTPVHAPASGRVVAASNYFFTGNTVYLDHGNGLFTEYAHLSQIHVEPGQWVSQGTLLGNVGTTGRSTGPHLHWGIYLNGNLVNPLLFVNAKQLTLATSKKETNTEQE